MATSDSTSNTWQAGAKRPKRGVPVGALAALSRMPADDLPQGSPTAAGRLPRVRLPLVRLGPASASPRCSTTARFEEWFAELGADRSVGLRRQEALCRTAEGRASPHRLARGRARRHRHDPRPARGVWRHRFGLHHGQHGRGGRRKADPAHRTGHARQPAADHHQCVGRRRGCTKESCR